MTSVGIIGASGFTGAELLRLCAQHPHLDVRLATGDTQAGSRVADLYPSLAAGYADLAFEKYDPDACDGLDLVFLGLPHGASQDVVPDLGGRVGRIVDQACDRVERLPAVAYRAASSVSLRVSFTSLPRSASRRPCQMASSTAG